jgi:hypothetical protein
VSQHTHIQGPIQIDGTWKDVKWVYGWDQHLMSFYLQQHDALIEDEDANPVIWLGATADTQMYEVEDLVREAKKLGFYIPYDMRVKLYGEKDDGS